MLIMNQQRATILNVSYIKEIEASFPWLEDAGKSEYAYVLAVDQSGKIMQLGRYASLDRAKAVLLEITQEYGKYLSTPGGPCLTVDAYVQPMAFEPPKVYMMPEE